MLGLMNDCIERFVTSRFGVKTWETIKGDAGCEVKNRGFLKFDMYRDDATLVLVEATAEVTGLPVEDVFRKYGAFFVEYIVEEGYGNLLYCQGRTLMEWLSGMNAMHEHLQISSPNKINPPEFWCEENDDGSLALFYMSSRGSAWVPFAEGLIMECAKQQFKLTIIMSLVSIQREEGARFTSWIVATENPDDLWKLRSITAEGKGGSNLSRLECPMTGMVINTKGKEGNDSGTFSNDNGSVTEYSLADSNGGGKAKFPRKKGPFGGGQSGRSTTGSKHSVSSAHSRSSQHSVANGSSVDGATDFEPGSLSASTTRSLFPYHAVINQDFAIVQVGVKLPALLGTNEAVLKNYDIDEVFKFLKPKQAKWTRSWMRKLENQEFALKCILDSTPSDVLFKGSLVATNPGEAMLILSPEANNFDELAGMNLTISDLPAHGCYRDNIFLREHLSKQMNNALKMEKLSMTLRTEKELLESLLPKHAAQGLREGKTVEPRIHYQVTMFFSDIVGFTNICKQIDPREVVAMLNRLYMVMDYLAKKFNLFKIETIGDAYVAASGMPDDDVNHSVNVANFAVAVSHCTRVVLSPLDGSPISIRIGINSGRCCSGIVGVTNPRYCVFGDTVNTTARLETTGEPGRVHCSMTTMIEHLKRAPDEFVHDSRGMIEMKGKGAFPSYWLSPTLDNKLVNKEGLEALDVEIMEKFGEQLKQGDCLARRIQKVRPAAPIPESYASIPGSLPDPDYASIPGMRNMDMCDHSLEDIDEGASYSGTSTDFGSSGSSPLGVSSRSYYTPTRMELVRMLGQFLDGESYGELLPDESIREDVSGDPNMSNVTNMVDEALKIMHE